MRNRQIQEERIKTYFLDAAKNLLRAEGLKGVSVRNVAYRAGYSYATLYNYFKDINDLLFRCVEDFCQEVGDFVAARTEGGAPGREGLRRRPGLMWSISWSIREFSSSSFWSGSAASATVPRRRPLSRGSSAGCANPVWRNALPTEPTRPERRLPRGGGASLHAAGYAAALREQARPDNYEEFMQSVDAQLGRVID